MEKCLFFARGWFVKSLSRARNVFVCSFSLFTDSCTFAGKHALSEHNQKALKTDYSSVTFEMESSPSCRICLCDCSKSVNVFGTANFLISQQACFIGLRVNLCITRLRAELEMYNNENEDISDTPLIYLI